MVISHFDAGLLGGLEYEAVTELPPYNEYLDHNTVSLAHVSGTEGEVGSISAVKLHAGGIRFIEMPISSFNVVADGELEVEDESGRQIISSGESFLTPPNWSGVLHVNQPTTMLLLVV